MKNSGFSVIELVVVLILLSVLTLFLIPGISGMIRDAKENTTQTSFRMISRAVNAYYTVSDRTSSKPVLPLERFDDPLDYLMQNNYFNTLPVDGWDRKIRVFIVSETVRSRVGLSGTEEINVFAGSYSINLASAGPDKMFGTSDDLYFTENRKIY